METLFARFQLDEAGVIPEPRQFITEGAL